ncbi:MAG: pyridoxal-dependent decarboxylase [Gemmatimonadota bacterium]|nr:MAG: pyridoxal-dependent decarboxylase [Gemmatimonadota bacterium]
MGPTTRDMPSEDFRAHALDVVEWIATYLEDVSQLPVLAQIQPGDVRASLPLAPPEQGEAFDRVLEDFRNLIVPGITHWNHPSFFAYFANTGSGPGILGEMLAAALNVNAMIWRSCPAATELEEHTLDWLRQALGLPEGLHGTINDTASSSSLYALAAAREQGLPQARTDGLAGGPAGVFYTSVEAHSSIEKAVITLGFGTNGVHKVGVDELFRLDPRALRSAIESDVAAGRKPLAVVATLGTTSSGSVDPVAEIAEVAEAFGLWLHVDAAYGGPAAILPEMGEHFLGWERADSIVVNPHKWLFTPVDCSVLYCRRPEMLRQAFSLRPDYLRTDDGDGTTDLMDYGISLGRRFRALKLWFVIRYFGVLGLGERIREHIRLGRLVGDWVEEHPDWELMAPVIFGTPVFRYAPRGRSPEEQDRLNQDVLDRANATGEAFFSSTRLKGRLTLRLSVGNLRTTEDHVRRGWELLKRSSEAASPV